MTNTLRPDAGRAARRLVSHRVELPDGRTLAVDDRPGAGVQAPVVLFLHAAPGSRRLDPDPALTSAAGVRLITVDRPGYGASSAPLDGVVPSLPAVAGDIAFALRELGIAEVGVAGWSTGGWVALALAARQPELVRALALVGTPAPDDEVPWVGEEYRAALGLLRADPGNALASLVGMLRAQAAGPAAAGSAAAGSAAIGAVAGGPADEAAVAADPARRERLIEMLTEAFRGGPVGAAADIIAVHVAPIGFDPRAVGAPVDLFYGGADEKVPPEHGRYWAGVPAEARLHEVPAVGHLVALTAWDEILAAMV